MAKISIKYCPKCGWLMRAAWLAQELLTTFHAELESLTLVPSTIAGVFQIYVDEVLVFDRKTFGGFAEPKVFKQLIRDKIAPQKELGHSDEKQ